MSLNKLMIIGHLGQNPELKHTPSGGTVCNFSVATNETWKDSQGAKQERVEWHRVVVWSKNAENCAAHLVKGSQVYVEGLLRTRTWVDKAGVNKSTTEVIAYDVKFLGSKVQAEAPKDMPSIGSSMDDIPF